MTGNNAVDDIQRRYFDEIGNYPVLTAAEEKDLSRRARGGDEKARKKLIVSNPWLPPLPEG